MRALGSFSGAGRGAGDESGVAKSWSGEHYYQSLPPATKITCYVHLCIWQCGIMLYLSFHPSLTVPLILNGGLYNGSESGAGA